MAKVKSKWVCTECGYETAGYLGKCPECGAWGTLVEEVQFASTPQNAAVASILTVLTILSLALFNKISKSDNITM